MYICRAELACAYVCRCVRVCRYFYLYMLTRACMSSCLRMPSYVHLYTCLCVSHASPLGGLLCCGVAMWRDTLWIPCLFFQSSGTWTNAVGLLSSAHLESNCVTCGLALAPEFSRSRGRSSSFSRSSSVLTPVEPQLAKNSCPQRSRCRKWNPAL